MLRTGYELYRALVFTLGEKSHCALRPIDLFIYINDNSTFCNISVNYSHGGVCGAQRRCDAMELLFDQR